MGFSRNDWAPILVASTAVSMVAWPLIMMTGMVSRPVVDHSLSRVTPSVSGIQMSSSTRSGRVRLRGGAGLRGVFGQFDVVAFVVQDFREQVADAQLVVYHQYVCHVEVRFLQVRLAACC
jgi:hypothetical protein